MSYSSSSDSDKYLPGEYYRKVLGRNKFAFQPDESTTMDSESFQRFLNLQRNPNNLYLEAIKYPAQFVKMMSLSREFGVDPGSL